MIAFACFLSGLAAGLWIGAAAVASRAWPRIVAANTNGYLAGVRERARFRRVVVARARAAGWDAGLNTALVNEAAREAGA